MNSLSLPLCNCVLCQSLTSPSLFLPSADLRWNLALCSSIYQSIILFLFFLLSFFQSVVADFRHMLNLCASTELTGIKIYTHTRTLGLTRDQLHASKCICPPKQLDERIHFILYPSVHLLAQLFDPCGDMPKWGCTDVSVAIVGWYVDNGGFWLVV